LAIHPAFFSASVKTYGYAERASSTKGDEDDFVVFLAPPKTDRLLDILQLLLVWTTGRLVNPSADRKQRRVIIVFIIIVNI